MKNPAVQQYGVRDRRALRTGVRLTVINIVAGMREGDAAGALREVQNAHPDVAIGSYPYYTDTGFGTNVVCRGKDPALVEAAGAALIEALRKAGGEARIVEPSEANDA